jgi:hypothetical protein
MLDKI